MSSRKVSITIPLGKPANPFAILGRARRAGKHGTGNQRQQGQKDLAQRLREAGSL